MRKIAILLIACTLFALTGCQGKSVSNPNANDDIDTPAVNLPDNGAAAQKEIPAVTATPKAIAPSGSIIEIKEKMFIAQINDIYLNQDDYLGKTIKYEGMFTQYTWEEKGMTYYSVYRKSPGCCGADGQAGFEVIWPDGSGKTYPNQNDWVEAVGVLGEYEEDGYTYLRLTLSSLTVLPTRGAEFVSQ